MNVTYVDKSIMKANSDEKKAVNNSVSKLVSRIEAYERDGTPFERIYNDDKVKYDVLGNGYYTFKNQTQRIQLRILYRLIDDDLQIHMVHVKKRNNKNYIGQFEEYVRCHSV